jgi:hypothetical protein
LECELLARRRFKTQAEARIAVFEFIFWNSENDFASAWVIGAQVVASV